MSDYNWLHNLEPGFAMRKHWEDGTYNDEACFQLRYTSDGPFCIVSGSSLLAKHVRSFRFDLDVIRKLGQVTDEKGRSIFDEGFLNHLQRMHLRVRVMMPSEGTLLLPGEPLLIATGPIDQIKVLESVFMELVWKSSHYATLAALERYRTGAVREENTPTPPDYDHNPDGWRMRGFYMGGGTDFSTIEKNANRALQPEEGLKLLWQEGKNNIGNRNALEQIRRLYKGNTPLADIWLPSTAEPKASVSKRSMVYRTIDTNIEKKIAFSRFVNLYQLVLFKGHSVHTSPKLEYRRQRTLHHLEYFSAIDFDTYDMGWGVV